MNVRSQFIKVRVTREEHRDIQKRADALGQTLSEYVRDTVTAVHERLDVVTALEALCSRCEAIATTTPATSSTDTDDKQEALALESVLLLRELAAARDAQILSRVRAQLRQRGMLATSAGTAS
jgi:hypothetical protein